MDEQRQQAYYQLIGNLLRCPNGEEPEILAANTDLLDAGFWQTLEAVAEDFAQQGEENKAGWLRNLATQLGAGLNLNRTTPDLEARQFLLEILRATTDSNGDAQVVYPLLAANTDKLNDNFAEILRHWPTNGLGEVEPETANYLAAVIGVFSNLMSQFPLGNKASNMEITITGYEIALTIFTRAANPQAWAMTQHDLGNAYLERIRGDQAENLEQALAAYSAALQIYTCPDFPQENVGTLYNLGRTYQNAQQFNLAYTTFADAIAGVEGLREEIISGDEAKRKQAEEWNRNYISMVEVCLELGNITAAIEYVERSKTRNLVENILQRDAKTIFPLEVVTQLEQLRDEIASGQYQIQNGKAENLKALAQHLQQLRQQRNDLQDQYLPVGSSFKFDSFQSTLDTNTAIIEWYFTSEKIIAFMIKPQGQEITVWQSQPEDRKALDNLIDEYLGDYYGQKDQWQNQLEERLNKLSEILHLEEVLTHVPKHCDRLILIPHRFLHLLPLHTLPVKESYLLDLFPKGVGYAPSCQLLQQVQLRQRTNFQSLFAIQTPTEDLYGKDLGAVGAIRKQFTSPDILKEAKAKKTAVIQDERLLKAHCLFFFCHGYFDVDSPLDSGLELADSTLTLAEIITNFKLDNCRLVTLAACETGFTDFRSTSDEYIGLPNGFLLAGSNNVVSSLWTVSAAATALLMIKFYEELRQQSNIIVALTSAQRWLRKTTARGFQDWLKTSALSFSRQVELNHYFAEQDANTKPFASPFYWSAFCAIGKGE